MTSTNSDTKDSTPASQLPRPNPSRWTRSLITRKALTVTYLITAVNQTSMFMYLSAMPYLFREHGITPVIYGYIQSAHAFLQLLSGPFLGQLADSSGARTILVMSMTSSAAGMLVMAVATSAAWLIVSRAASVFMDIMPGAMMTVTDLVPSSERGVALGRIMVPMSLGMILGPLIGGYLTQKIGTSMTLAVAACVCILSISVLNKYVPRKPASLKATTQEQPSKRSNLNWTNVKALLTNGDVLYLLILRFLGTLPGMLFMMNLSVAGIHVFHLTPQTNGMMFSCLGCINMLNNGVVLGMISRRFPPASLLSFSACLSVATYFLMSQVTEVWQLVILLYPINLSYAILENQIMTRLTRSAEAKYTSTMLGLGTSLFHLSRTLAPSIGGLLMAQHGWSAIGLLGGTTSLALALLVLLRSEPAKKTE